MLFVALVVVFDRGQTGKRWHFLAICYVAAAAIAGITVGIAGGKSEIYDGYFREDACWLDGGYLWAFIGPVAVVLVFNTVILVKALMEAYRVRTWKFKGKRRLFFNKSVPLPPPGQQAEGGIDGRRDLVQDQVVAQELPHAQLHPGHHLGVRLLQHLG